MTHLIEPSEAETQRQIKAVYDALFKTLIGKPESIWKTFAMANTIVGERIETMVEMLDFYAEIADYGKCAHLQRWMKTLALNTP